MLFGCSSTLKINGNDMQHHYSDKFRQSEFMKGWIYVDAMGKDEGCGLALPHFEEGITARSYFELSTLYYDYCVGATEHINSLFTSSIYSGNERYRGVTRDELRWIDEMASKGKPVESFAIGKMYLHGYKVQKNHDLALYFMATAAKQAYGHAQMQLALALMENDDEGNAIQWFKRAKENGYPGAEGMYNALSQIYQD